MRRSPRASPITGGEILEAVAMLSHLVPTCRSTENDQQNDGNQETNDAENYAGDGNAPAGVALWVGVDLDQADDRKNQTENVEWHAVTATTADWESNYSQYHPGNRQSVICGAIGRLCGKR